MKNIIVNFDLDISDKAIKDFDVAVDLTFLKCHLEYRLQDIQKGYYVKEIIITEASLGMYQISIIFFCEDNTKPLSPKKMIKRVKKLLNSDNMTIQKVKVIED